MSGHLRFADNAGFMCHCWECVNATDWHGDIGRCVQTGIVVGKYDSPNNCCSNVGGCGYYKQPERLRKEGVGE